MVKLFQTLLLTIPLIIKVITQNTSNTSNATVQTNRTFPLKVEPVNETETTPSNSTNVSPAANENTTIIVPGTEPNTSTLQNPWGIVPNLVNNLTEPLKNTTILNVQILHIKR